MQSEVVHSTTWGLDHLTFCLCRTGHLWPSESAFMGLGCMSHRKFKIIYLPIVVCTKAKRALWSQFPEHRLTFKVYLYTSLFQIFLVRFNILNSNILISIGPLSCFFFFLDGVCKTADCTKAGKSNISSLFAVMYRCVSESNLPQRCYKGAVCL